MVIKYVIRLSGSDIYAYDMIINLVNSLNIKNNIKIIGMYLVKTFSDLCSKIILHGIIGNCHVCYSRCYTNKFKKKMHPTLQIKTDEPVIQTEKRQKF